MHVLLSLLICLNVLHVNRIRWCFFKTIGKAIDNVIIDEKETQYVVQDGFEQYLVISRGKQAVMDYLLESLRRL